MVQMPSGVAWEKKGVLFWLVDFKGGPFPKKGTKGTTGQLGNGTNSTPLEISQEVSGAQTRGGMR